MVGVGLEEVGVEEFVSGKFFNGDLFIDMKKQCYQDLGYRRLGVLGTLGAIFGKKSREANTKAKADKLGGDLKGDGLQNGGTLIVTAGGKEVLLDYKQENAADHVELSEVLRVLGIEGAPPQAEEAGASCPDVNE